MFYIHYLILILSINTISTLCSLGKNRFREVSNSYSHTIQSLYCQTNSVISNSQVHNIQTVLLIRNPGFLLIEIQMLVNDDHTNAGQFNNNMSEHSAPTLCNQAWTFLCLCNCNKNKAPNIVYNLKAII